MSKRSRTQRSATVKSRKKGYKLKLQKAKARERTIKGWKTKWMKAGGRKVGPQKFKAKDIEVRKRRLFGVENPDDDVPVFTRRARSKSPQEELDELGQIVGQRQGWGTETIEGLREAQQRYLAEGTFLGLEGVTSRKQIREKLKEDMDLTPEQVARLDDNTVDMLVEGLQKQSERQFLLRVADELIGHGTQQAAPDVTRRGEVPGLQENYASLRAYKRIRDQEEPIAVPPGVKQLAKDVEERNMDVAGPGTKLRHVASVIANPDVRSKRKLTGNVGATARSAGLPGGRNFGVTRHWTEAERVRVIKNELGITTAGELLEAAQSGKLRQIEFRPETGLVREPHSGRPMGPFNVASEMQIVDNVRAKIANDPAKANEEISPDDVKYRESQAPRTLSKKDAREEISNVVYGAVLQTRDPMTDMGAEASKRLPKSSTAAEAAKSMPVTYGPLGEPLKPKIVEVAPGDFKVTWDFATRATASGGKMKDVSVQSIPLARATLPGGSAVLRPGADPTVERLVDALVKSNYGESAQARMEGSREAQRLAGQLGTNLDVAYTGRLEQAATEIARRHFLAERQQVAGGLLDDGTPIDPRFGQFGKPAKAEDYYDANLQRAHIGPETGGPQRLKWEAKNLLAKAQGKNFYAPKPLWFQSIRSHADLEKNMAQGKIDALRGGRGSMFFNYEKGRGIVPGGSIGTKGEKNPIENADFSITPNYLNEYTLNEINTKAEGNTVYPNDPKAGSTGRKLGEVRGFKGDQTVRFEQIPGEERKMVLEPWNAQTQFKDEELQAATDAQGNIRYDKATGRPLANVRQIPRFDEGMLHIDPGMRVPIGHQPSKEAKEIFIERPYDVIDKLRSSPDSQGRRRDVVTIPNRSRETFTEYYRLDYPSNPDEGNTPDRVRIDREEFEKLPDVEKGDRPNKEKKSYHKAVRIKYVAPGETMLGDKQSDVAFLTLGRGKLGTKYGYNVGVRLDENADSRAADVARLGLFEPLQHLQTIRNEPIEQGVAALHQIETEPREGDAKTLDTLRSEHEKLAQAASEGGWPLPIAPPKMNIPNADQRAIERIASDPRLQDQVKKEYARRYGVDERTAENNLKTLVLAAGSAAAYKGRNRIFGEGQNFGNKALQYITGRVWGGERALDQVFDAYKTTGRRSLGEWVYDVGEIGAAIRHPLSSLSGRTSGVKARHIVPERLLSPSQRELRTLQDLGYEHTRFVGSAERLAETAQRPGLRGMIARDYAKFAKKHIEKRAEEVAAEEGKGARGPMSVFDKTLKEVAKVTRPLSDDPDNPTAGGLITEKVPQEGRSLFQVLRGVPKHTNVERQRQVVIESGPTGPYKVEITRPIKEEAAKLSRSIKGEHGLGERLVKVNKQLGQISDKSIPAPPVFPRMNRWSKGSFSPTEKHVLIGAGVVGTAAGAAYLYHRHQEKKRKEADPTYQGMTWYNKVLPPTFKSPVPKPSWQTTKTYTVPGTEFTNYFQFSGNEIPVGGRLHFNRPEVSLRPMDRKDVVGDKYISPTAGLGIPRLRGVKTTPKGVLKSFITDPEVHEAFGKGRKSFVPQGEEIKLFGKSTPFWIDVGKEKQLKLSRTNKYKMTDKDREALIASVYGTPQERQVRDFFTFGTHDKIVDMMNDPEEVARIFKTREQKKLTKEQFKKQRERAAEAGVHGIEERQPTPDEKIQQLEATRKEMAKKGELSFSMDAAISDAQREIKAKQHSYPDIPGEYPIPWMGASFGSRSDIIHQEVTDGTRRIEPKEAGGFEVTQVDERPRLRTGDGEGGTSPEIIRRTGPEVNREQMRLFGTPHVDVIDLEAREAVQTDNWRSGRRGDFAQDDQPSPRDSADAFGEAQRIVKEEKMSKAEAKDPKYKVGRSDMQDKFEGGIGFI